MRSYGQQGMQPKCFLLNYCFFADKGRTRIRNLGEDAWCMPGLQTTSVVLLLVYIKKVEEEEFEHTPK